MKLLDRHIIREIAPTFFATVVLFAGFILIAAGPLLRAVSYLSAGVPAWLVIQVIGLYLPPQLVLAFPMGVLIAVILGFSRLSNDSEAVAMFSSGVSFYRMLLPTALFGLAVAGVGLIINNSIVPAANHRITDLKANVINNITHEVPETTEPIVLPFVYTNKKIQAVAIALGGFNTREDTIKQVTIIEYDLNTQRPIATVYAKGAKWDGGSAWTLHDAQVITNKGVVASIPDGVTQDIKSTPATVSFLQDSPDDLTFAQLARQIQILKASGVHESSNLRDAEVSLWNKISLPLASFIFALVAAPLALRPQRGASRQAGFSYGILIILGYYAVEKYLEILATSGQLDPALAAFIPNLLGAALAGWLISRATT